MLELANTTLTVMRGTAENAYGDKTDVGFVLYQGVPAAIVETGSSVFDSATQTRRIIRQMMCVVPDWADITTDDTLKDETTGYYYMIEGIQTQPNLGLPPETILTLRARSGVRPQTD